MTPGNLRLPGLGMPVAIELGVHVGQVRMQRLDGSAGAREKVLMARAVLVF